MAGQSIYDDIIKTLEENGELDSQQYRRLVLYAFVDLGRGRVEIKEIKKKVERLERYSILLIARQHPKTTKTILAMAVLFVVIVIAQLGLWTWLAELLKIPLP